MAQPSTQVLLASGHSSEYFWYAQGTGVFDAKNNAMLSKTGSAGMSTDGSVNVALGNSSTYYTAGSFLPLVAPYTIRVRAKSSDSSNSMVAGDTSSDASFIWINNSGSLTYRIPFQYTGYEAISQATDASALATYTITVDGSRNYAIYKDGTSIKTGTISGTAQIEFWLRSLLGGYSGGSYSLNGAFEFAHVIPGSALSSGAIASLDADPYSVLDSGDTTAPTLSSASVSAVGTTTATGNVTTDEGNGTLYSIVSTSATAPSVAQIQAGQTNTGATAVWSGNQAVSSTGAKTFSITGLTASTAYYAHFQHKDAATNNSTVVTSAQFTTATPDTTVPTLTGSVTISAKTTTSYTATWPAGSDNVAVTGYEYRLNSGSWVDAGNVLTTNISARTPGSTDAFEVRAYDAAANKSTPALSVSVTLLIGTITIPAVKDWSTGNLKTSETGVQVDVHNISTGALVVRKTGQTTHATTGVCVVKDSALADATTYEVVTRFADGSKGMWDYTASNT